MSRWMAYIEKRLRSRTHTRTDYNSHWLAMTPWNGAREVWEFGLIDLCIHTPSDELHIIMPLDRAREMVAELERAIPHTERDLRLRAERAERTSQS